MPLLETRGAASVQGFGALAASARNYIEDVFSTYLYTGNGSTQTITNGIDLSGKGGLVWIKARSAGQAPRLWDTARGINLTLDSTVTTGNNNEPGSLTAFNSNGFSLGSAYSQNTSSTTYVSWTFRKQAKFFDVVTYTGNGANRTISHNLGSVPGCIIVKRTDTTADWQVYHRSIANTEYLVLNTTAAKATGATRWNSTTATSTEFSLGTDTTVNANTGTYVAYLFAHDAGGFGASGSDNVITCGSFTTDGSGNATVTLGYEPQFLITKITNALGAWDMFDSMRGLNVSSTSRLSANTSNAENNQTTNYVQPNATGFAFVNGFGGPSNTYIYIAIRRGPMKTPTSGTSVFIPTTYSGTGVARSITGFDFPPDLVMCDSKSFANNFTYDKLRGANNRLFTNDTAGEINDADRVVSFDQTGFSLGTLNPNESGISYANWNFRRAPGFFDEVCYTGTGVARTVTHNLGVVPELIIVKNRTAGASWIIYHAALGATQYLTLNTTDNAFSASSFWNNTSPTASVFSVGTAGSTNSSGASLVAYLFATCPGVSKVGSYTGTGSTLQINCGFTGGARFVLIKRTDSTGDWYVWDSARGIVAGNDPYLLLNSTAAEVTSTDYVDTYSAGFEISSTAPAAINANGGSFIFLAIA